MSSPTQAGAAPKGQPHRKVNSLVASLEAAGVDLMPINDTSAMVDKDPANPIPQSEVIPLVEPDDRVKELLAETMPINNTEPQNVTDPEITTPTDKPVTPIVEPEKVTVDVGQLFVDERVTSLKTAQEDYEGAQLVIDQSQQQADYLEQIAEVVEAAAENGTMNRTNAQLTEIAVEALLNTLGMKPESRTLPSLESFGGVGSRIAAGQLACEAMKDTIVAVWQKLIAALKAAAQKAVAFVTEILGSATRVKARADKVRKISEGVSGQAKSSTVANPGVVTALSIDGRVGNPIQSLMKVREVMKSVVRETNRWAGEDFTKLYIGTDSKAVDLNALVDQFDGKNVNIHTFSKAVGGLYKTDTLPGERKLAFMGVPENEVELSSLRSVRFFMEQTDATRPRAQAIPTLTVKQCTDILDLVMEMCDMITENKPVLERLKDQKAALVSRAEKVMASVKDDMSAEEKGQDQALSALIMVSNRLLGQPATVFQPYMLNVCNAMINYVIVSLKAYEPVAEAATAPAAA